MKYLTIYHISTKPVFMSTVLKMVFFMYNDKVSTRKIDVINHISHSVIPMYWCQKMNLSLMLPLMTLHPSLKYFQRKKWVHYMWLRSFKQNGCGRWINTGMKSIHPTQVYRGFDFWSEWLFQYHNELTLGESIEIDYLNWKS